MKHTIYIVTIIALFAACKQNAKNETATEATQVVVDTAAAVRQAPVIEQPAETAKLDLPFVGKRWYDFGEGILNAGADGGGVIPNYYIEIKEDGDVYFGIINIENRTKKQYPSKPVYAGKYEDIMSCAYKGSDGDNPCVSDYYKITSSMIYKVNKSGNVLSDEVCCNTMFPNGACKCETKLEKNPL